MNVVDGKAILKVDTGFCKGSMGLCFEPYWGPSTGSFSFWLTRNVARSSHESSASGAMMLIMVESTTSLPLRCKVRSLAGFSTHEFWDSLLFICSVANGPPPSIGTPGAARCCKSTR